MDIWVEHPQSSENDAYAFTQRTKCLGNCRDFIFKYVERMGYKPSVVFRAATAATLALMAKIATACTSASKGGVIATTTATAATAAAAAAVTSTNARKKAEREEKPLARPKPKPNETRLKHGEGQPLKEVWRVLLMMLKHWFLFVCREDCIMSQNKLTMICVTINHQKHLWCPISCYFIQDHEVMVKIIVGVVM